MKKYVVIEKDQIDLEKLSDSSRRDLDLGFRIVEATSSIEAIRKYLNLAFKCELEKNLKDMLFKDFIEWIKDDDCEEFEGLINKNTIFEMGDKIISEFFWESNADDEEGFLKASPRLEEAKETYWKLLSLKERELAYYICRREKVFCWPIKSLPQWQKESQKEAQNIVKDVEKNDLIIWNLISELIRCEEKTIYRLTINDFFNYIGTSETAQDLLNYCLSYKLKGHIYYDSENGDIISGSLTVKDPEIDNMNNTISICPSEYLVALAKAGYDFNDRKNDVANAVFQNIQYKRKRNDN